MGNFIGEGASLMGDLIIIGPTKLSPSNYSLIEPNSTKHYPLVEEEGLPGIVD